MLRIHSTPVLKPNFATYAVSPSAIRSDLDTYQVLNECGGFGLPGRRAGTGIAATLEGAGTPAPNEPEGFAGAGGRGEGEGPALGWRRRRMDSIVSNPDPGQTPVWCKARPRFGILGKLRNCTWATSCMFAIPRIIMPQAGSE